MDLVEAFLPGSNGDRKIIENRDDRLGMMAHTCHTVLGWRQEDSKFKDSLGYKGSCRLA